MQIVVTQSPPKKSNAKIVGILDAGKHHHCAIFIGAVGTNPGLPAFDFAKFYNENPEAKFLFLAHREEILKQARSAYRGVLKNSQFGELLVGQYKPEKFNHLFTIVKVAT